MRIGQELEEAPQRSILLDYDGTLREIVGHPDLATPTAEIVELLDGLAALPGTDVHVVSGRRRESLERGSASADLTSAPSTATSSATLAASG